MHPRSRGGGRSRLPSYCFNSVLSRSDCEIGKHTDGGRLNMRADGKTRKNGLARETRTDTNAPVRHLRPGDDARKAQ
jgi:hypothetical protein